MNSPLLLACALVAIPLISAFGQEKPVASVPENMSWTVVFTPQGVKNAGDSTHSNLQVRNAYSNGLRMFTRVGADDREQRSFLVRNFLIAPGPDGKAAVSALADVGSFASPVSLPSDLSAFAEFEWVRSARFCGVVDYAGHHCAKYEETTETSGTGETKAGPSQSGMASAEPPPAGNATQNLRPTILRTAYIDSTNRLPVALVDAGGTYAYAFKKLTEPLVLPPEYAAALREAEARLEKDRMRHRIPQ